MKEIDTVYYSRPEGSFSKLSTYKDGIRILKTIVSLIKDERPLLFFGAIAFVSFTLGLICGIPVIWEFIQTGRVPRFPTAILASALMICAFISMLIGLVLDCINTKHKEISRQNYLRY